MFNPVYYTYRFDSNKKSFYRYNVFNNINVYESTEKLVKDYKRKKMTFQAFTYELQSIISWQESGRYEYEVVLQEFTSNNPAEEKIDCYLQTWDNIKMIARTILEDYYPHLKIKPEEMDFPVNRWPHINKEYLTKSKDEVEAELEKKAERLNAMYKEILDREDI